MLNIYSTLITSIIVQIITGVIEISALFIKVPERKHFLKQMMLLEVIVQIIEGIFYFVWFLHFKRIKNITPSRYFDWAITTPTMLINLIFYLIFLQDNNVHFFELFKKEFYTIITVLLLNWMMLFFGYLGEIHRTPVTGVLLGFIPFLLYYYIIYKKYAIGKGVRLFFYFFIVWCFYGIVALFSYKIKNMCYNVLDLFSKNFFGLFLTYLIFNG
jgi:bacteriorhodopsin